MAVIMIRTKILVGDILGRAEIAKRHGIDDSTVWFDCSGHQLEVSDEL